MSQVRNRFGAVLDFLDYLVTGPYDERRRTRGIPFISSSNQEIHCLTPPAWNAFQSYACVHEFEVVIRKDGPHVVCLGGILPHSLLGRPRFWYGQKKLPELKFIAWTWRREIRGASFRNVRSIPARHQG
jgi:hypothetical protein